MSVQITNVVILMEFQLFTGKIPHPTMSDIQAIEWIYRGGLPMRPSSMPDYVWRLATLCWDHDPNRRPSMEQLVQALSDDG